MATIKFTMSGGTTFASMNEHMAIDGDCGTGCTWNGEAITSDTLDVTESGTLHLCSGGANSYLFSHDLSGDITLTGDEVLTINYTATKSAVPGHCNGGEFAVTYQATEKTIVARILYGDTVIAELADGETATLKTEGKIASEDIVIEKVGSVSLISFTVDGTSYQAEDGMTWGEWVASDYNSGWSVLSDTYIYRTNSYSNFEYVTKDGTYSGRVKSTDTITDGTTYQVYEEASSG